MGLGAGSGGGNYPSSAASVWRQTRNSKSQTYYGGEESGGGGGCLYAGDNWRGADHQHDIDTDVGIMGTGVGSNGGAMATPHGTISLRLRNRIRVDMTIDRAVRIINFKVHVTEFN